MVPVNNSRAYMSTRDCSQGFCSLYCPQWCYIIFPPPPPFDDFPDDDDDSGPNFSPLIIGIIGILASAFLLLSYYVIMSKCCGHRDAFRRRDDDHLYDSELEENQDPSNHETWHVNTTGLDESLIKSITVLKYKKGGGLAEGTDCSVCLSEFQEDESLKLLPKCSHAFHVTCIDTWLKSHSNCPLCRSTIVFVNASPPPLVIEVIEAPLINERTFGNQPQNDREMGVREEDVEVAESRVLKSLITENMNAQIRRSVSMDQVSRGVLSIADILKFDHDEDSQMGYYRFHERDVGTSKQEVSSSENRNSTLPHCVSNPMAMKRSFFQWEVHVP
ncbi:PREDICTED: RING-H2 finger protein ATL51-like [Nicotiana attenuata]|uniref:RING-type E3 ubiquitin transferase n=1 Tax=Nicotiana attenuata TaxID=49451 RepID=A0A314KTC2_NICAT|nr:PREDICTED: RING-H2 finger protein ATL51-like [Nicotiana attenuata]OIT32572.1 ring-h2 finger protein atl52 [Nicotiana attenuata]